MEFMIFLEGFWSLDLFSVIIQKVQWCSLEIANDKYSNHE